MFSYNNNRVSDYHCTFVLELHLQLVTLLYRVQFSPFKQLRLDQDYPTLCTYDIGFAVNFIKNMDRLIIIYLQITQYNEGWEEIQKVVPKNRWKRFSSSCFVGVGAFKDYGSCTLCGRLNAVGGQSVPIRNDGTIISVLCIKKKRCKLITLVLTFIHKRADSSLPTNIYTSISTKH